MFYGVVNGVKSQSFAVTFSHLIDNDEVLSVQGFLRMSEIKIVVLPPLALLTQSVKYPKVKYYMNPS